MDVLRTAVLARLRHYVYRFGGPDLDAPEDRAEAVHKLGGEEWERCEKGFVEFLGGRERGQIEERMVKDVERSPAFQEFMTRATSVAYLETLLGEQVRKHVEDALEAEKKARGFEVSDKDKRGKVNGGVDGTSVEDGESGGLDGTGADMDVDGEAGEDGKEGRDMVEGSSQAEAKAGEVNGVKEESSARSEEKAHVKVERSGPDGASSAGDVQVPSRALPSVPDVGAKFGKRKRARVEDSDEDGDAGQAGAKAEKREAAAEVVRAKEEVNERRDRKDGEWKKRERDGRKEQKVEHDAEVGGNGKKEAARKEKMMRADDGSEKKGPANVVKREESKEVKDSKSDTRDRKRADRGDRPSDRLVDRDRGRHEAGGDGVRVEGERKTKADGTGSAKKEKESARDTLTNGDEDSRRHRRISSRVAGSDRRHTVAVEVVDEDGVLPSSSSTESLPAVPWTFDVAGQYAAFVVPRGGRARSKEQCLIVSVVQRDEDAGLYLVRDASPASESEDEGEPPEWTIPGRKMVEFKMELKDMAQRMGKDPEKDSQYSMGQTVWSLYKMAGDEMSTEFMKAKVIRVYKAKLGVRFTDGQECLVSYDAVFPDWARRDVAQPTSAGGVLDSGRKKQRQKSVSGPGAVFASPPKSSRGAARKALAKGLFDSDSSSSVDSDLSDPEMSSARGKGTSSESEVDGEHGHVRARVPEKRKMRSEGVNREKKLRTK
ncbi:hypothetical protein M427DRAFT_131205 [Gonapodya prolifera JEL478]|uniref:SGF29 C-terminal domain-containing protein n=1 Tax=Gonapodya prolifera (strain JEL478) TaxID=1344416 RepID=A0A139AUG6_GONPJ|nr:hypothetical protein M427DRAFT_131205 [Gonapodya prolifera JEL478]|eukprot:KXS20349.1 hypothetical protein M427DRAFT_131205 [Gonapodya prolifera JEL478]